MRTITNKKSWDPILRVLCAFGTLVVLIACEGSPKSTSTAPATPPQKISGSVSKPAPPTAEKPGTPLSAKVAAKTLSVEPPASFDTDQLGSGVVAFLVSGNAKQTLLVKLSRPDAGSVAALRPSSSSPLMPGGDNNGNFLFPLPQAGAYRVLFEPTSRGTNIQFQFVAQDDPMIDPGIKSDQISVNFGVFARRTDLTVVPYADFEGDEDEYWPSHLAAERDHFEFRIMSTALHRKLLPQDNSLELLERALKQDLAAVKLEELPYTRETRWCGYTMTVRRTVLQGNGWRGLRWIGGFGGDEAYPSCGLGYVFNGITDDGRFLIVARADLSHPDLKRLLPPREIHRTAHGSWESSDPETDAKMRTRLERALTAASPDSFQPSIAKLDAVVRSLRLRQ